MANLTEEQIKEINLQYKNGAIFTEVFNTKYGVLLKINTESIVIQSMIQEDNNKGIIINLADLRKSFDDDRTNKAEDQNTCDSSAQAEENIPSGDSIS